MREVIGLVAVISAIVAVIAVVNESKAAPLAIGREIETIRGHDYLIVWNGCSSCCVIHAESCPCKSGKDTGGVR